MDSKLKNLLDKILYPNDKYEVFKNSSLSKIKVLEDDNKWNIYLKNDTNFLYIDIKDFLAVIKSFTKNKYDINIKIKVDSEDLSLIEDYYQNILVLINNNNLYHDMFLDRLVRVENEYLIEVYNKNEELLINKKIDLINKYFKDFGFSKTISIKYNYDNSLKIKEEIGKDLLDTGEFIVKSVEHNKKFKKSDLKKEKDFRKNSKINDESVLLGKKINGAITKINDITYEIDNVTVEVEVFGVVPSNKKGFNSITLKVSDKVTSMYVRVFLKSEEEYNDLLKKIYPGINLLINGYVKNNTYYNDFVLNARSISLVEKESKVFTDDCDKKRVELHTHTMMSQMDGVVDVKDLIQRAISYGHKAIAITDHNAVQTFPVCTKFMKDIKIVYGVELQMIDDDLDLVFRADSSVLLDNTYVVFDFETTGLNAGAGDSIIEVGAVKLKNGEIIDRFDKFINPGKKLPPHIVEITNITDDMLKDCDDEETVIKSFIKWVGDLPMVAHNAKFDASFLEMAYKKYNLGKYENVLIDTLQLSRALDTDQTRHSLSVLVKRYEIPWDEDAHHRADYDSEGTALIFYKMLKRLDLKKIVKVNEINNLIDKEDIHKIGNLYHINILVKNSTGLKNLFKLVSLANTKYLYKTPRILRSKVEELREGLFITSGCSNGEIFTLARSKTDEELSDLMNFYDIIEVQPPEVNSYIIDTESLNGEIELQEITKKIINLALKKNLPVIATGDVHHLDREDKVYREIIINQKVPGGGRHPLNRSNIKTIPSQHFRTTSEMLEDFSFIDKSICEKIVIDNPNEIVDLIEDFDIIPDTKGIPFSPIIKDSEKTIKEIVYNKAKSIYGDPLPDIVNDRITSELDGIISGGFDAIYLIAQKLVEKSNNDGYTVGSRGSVGSSFVATMLNVTEVNPLPAHYVCPSCKISIFSDNEVSFNKDYPSGYDLPDRKCSCGEMMRKEGQDMPFATFLGFNADKVPDIDLNFSGDYQALAHDYTKILFGEDKVFRAGTIGTVADKTAFGFVKGYFEDRGITDTKAIEIERLALGVTGVKRTTGQHPGGIVVVPDYKEIFDFTPYGYPADQKGEWYTTHFNYHDIEDCLLKLDILGHDNPTYFKMLYDLTGIKEADIPMDDKGVMSLFESPKALGVTSDKINCNTGCLGLPEFTKFVMGIVEETRPTTFAELVKISGLSHGTDVWMGNAQELVRNNVVPFKEIIGCRDDIMVYLINKGLEPIDAFTIMELVRKGKALKDKDKWKKFKKQMQDHNVPDWYIKSCETIKYMFPKAHATAYITAAFRIAWFKINKPIEYYATFFSIKCFAFDLMAMEQGYDKLKEALSNIDANRYNLSVKEQDLLGTLEVALEMCARGFKFGSVDLYKSDAKNFIIDDDNMTLIPPFRALEGLGDTVAKTIVEERLKKEFLSIDDLQKRGKVSSTLIERMKLMGILKNLPESSQISLFDLV